MKILLVDDQDQFLHIISSLFRSRGDEVLTATNGVEALEQARDKHPDCIVSDILMPLMDGLQLCRECRRDAQLHNIPFIFATGTFTSPRDRGIAVDAGADGFLVKTQDPDAFLRGFDDVLVRLESDRKPNEGRPVEDSAAALREYNETLVRTVIDKVEKLQQANERLQESEERLAALIAALPVPVLIFRRDGGMELVNASFTATFGYGREDVADVDEWWRLACPDAACRDTIRNRVAELPARTETGTPSEAIDVRVACKDGGYRHVEFTQVMVGELNVNVFVDLTDRVEMEKTVRRLVEAPARQTGKAFFEAMAGELADALGAGVTFIGRLRREDGACRIRTLSVTVDGKPVPDFEYDLAGTPCERVVDEKACAFAANVAELFPKSDLLREMSIQGYVGTPLYSSVGDPIGVMAAMYRSPRESTEFAESILRIFSARVGGEIERREAELELREHREHLEELVRERTEKLETANAALRERAEELERFTQLAVGREKAMIKLKQEINGLLEKAGEPPMYRIVV